MPVSEFRLLAMALDSGWSVPFPRCVILLVILALRRFIGADDFDTLIFDMKVFRALKENSPPSRDLRRVSSPSRYIRFYHSQNSYFNFLYLVLK